MRKVLLKKVTDELINLKNKATSDEIDRLDLTSFDPLRSSQCVYGQMTGNCLSERAKELSPKKYEDL